MIYPQSILNNYKAFEMVVQYKTDCLSRKTNQKAASGVRPVEAALLYGYIKVCI